MPTLRNPCTRPIAYLQALMQQLRNAEVLNPLASVAQGEGGAVPSPEGLAAVAAALDQARTLQENGRLFQEDRCALPGRVWAGLVRQR